MEHLLNVYAARHARGAVADFLGYCEVEYGQASGKLSEGVWLVRDHPCSLPQATCDRQIMSTSPCNDRVWLWCGHSVARVCLALSTRDVVTAWVTGLYLRRLAQVWRYEGARTLAAYLRRRDCVPALARDLGVPAEAVAATVLRHILEGLTVRAAPPQPQHDRHHMGVACCLLSMPPERA